MTDIELGEDSEGRPVLRCPLNWSLVLPIEEDDVGNGPQARRAFVPRGACYVETPDGRRVNVILKLIDDAETVVRQRMLYERMAEMGPCGRNEK